MQLQVISNQNGVVQYAVQRTLRGVMAAAQATPNPPTTYSTTTVAAPPVVQYPTTVTEGTTVGTTG